MNFSFFSAVSTCFVFWGCSFKSTPFLQMQERTPKTPKMIDSKSSSCNTKMLKHFILEHI